MTQAICWRSEASRAVTELTPVFVSCRCSPADKAAPTAQPANVATVNAVATHTRKGEDGPTLLCEKWDHLNST